MTIRIYFFIVLIFLFSNTVSSFGDERLINELSQDNWESQFMDQRILEDLKKEDNLDKLLLIANNKGLDWRVRIRVIKILGEMHYKRVIPYLIKMFNDPFFHNECPSIKSSIASALGNYNDKDVINSLINNINDPEIIVREEVIKSIGRIGDSSTLPYLINTLNDKNFAIKIASIKAIEKIGDSSAISALKRIISEDKDILLKREAEIAIERLMKLNLRSTK